MFYDTISIIRHGGGVMKKLTYSSRLLLLVQLIGTTFCAIFGIFWIILTKQLQAPDVFVSFGIACVVLSAVMSITNWHSLLIRKEKAILNGYTCLRCGKKGEKQCRFCIRCKNLESIN